MVSKQLKEIMNDEYGQKQILLALKTGVKIIPIQLANGRFFRISLSVQPL